VIVHGTHIACIGANRPYLYHLDRNHSLMIRSCCIAVITMLCIALWLVLLEVTNFSALSVSAGLLGGLFVTGTTR
jgi:hypothetical protein